MQVKNHKKIILILYIKKTADFPAVFCCIQITINVNKIRRPILVTFVQDMEHPQTQVREQKSQ